MAMQKDRRQGKSSDKLRSTVASRLLQWLEEEESPLSPGEKRAAYIEYLQSRLNKLDSLAKAAADAR